MIKDGEIKNNDRKIPRIHKSEIEKFEVTIKIMT
jgi:hypothetical protein